MASPLAKTSPLLGNAARAAVAPFLGRRRLQPVFDVMHRLALLGLGFGPHQTWETGEIRALTRLAHARQDAPQVVFDVGANTGQWATWATTIFRLEEMHCFEPSPQAFAKLEQTISHPAVRLHRIALGDQDGEVDLFSDAPGSQLSSLYNRDLDYAGHQFTIETTVAVRRLDSFCSDAGIRHINLLKLDMEGSELACLHGAGDLLEEGAIEAIQFEFGTTTEAGVFFKDIFFLLNPNYRLYRIIRGGLVPVDEYRERWEIFLPANYLALSRAAAALRNVD